MKSFWEDSSSRKSSTNEETHSSEIKGGWDGGRVMLRWRKSLWKHIWKKLLCYICIYFLISILYRFALNAKQQATFTKIIEHFKESSEGVPLTFILGLYIGLVVKRWWDQYTSLPWPDDLALHLRACIFAKTKDKDGKVKEETALKVEQVEARKVRRTIVRYSLVSYILAVRRQSSRLRDKFPHAQDIVVAGLLEEDELKLLQEKDTMEMYTSRWWVPIQWCMELLANAEQEGLVVNPPSYSSLVSQVKIFKQGLQKVKAYGNLPVPLVYTQVVTLAVYVFFAVALIKDQYIIGKSVDKLDMVFPFFLTFKFMFYYGLLSVAKSIYNPWGMDEEDFQMNKLLARHLRVSMAIVDDTNTAPQLKEDKFWNDPNPEMLGDKEQLPIDHGRNVLSSVNCFGICCAASKDQSHKRSVISLCDHQALVSNVEKSDPGKNAVSQECHFPVGEHNA